MTYFLPMFPLKVIVYPGEDMNLHIFEPRYKQLINECKELGVTFGIPTFIDESVADFGTEMKLVEIRKTYEDGRLDIKTRGLHVFRLLKFKTTVAKKLYPGGKAQRLGNVDDYDILLQEQINEQLLRLYEALNIKNEIGNKKSFDLAHHIGLSFEQEYELLQMERESDRQSFILEHLEHIVPVVIQTEKLKKKIKLNGHFKNFDKLNF